MSDQPTGERIIAGQEEQAQQRLQQGQEKEAPAPSLIPAELRDAAAEAVAAEEARRRAFREQVEKEERCAGAVRAFRHATNDLWCAPAGKARPLLPTVHTALLGACAALAEAGRLGAWEQVDHARTYDGFRVRNNRTLSRPSYDWGCKLLGMARDGLLTEALLVETWEAPGLQDAVRWLSVFIEGLSGEGAALPGTGQQPALPAPAPPQQAGRPAAEAEGASEGGGDRPDMSLRRVGEVWHLRFQGENADFPVRGNRFLGWLAKLLAKPDHAWTVGELNGDPDGKVKADALLGGEYEKDKEALRKIRERIEDIDAMIEETGGSEKLEEDRAELLRHLERHSARKRMGSRVGKAYNNITTQKRMFLEKLEGKMPKLATHLQACIVPSGRDYTISYRPPAGTPRWQVENPPA
jgi:hypothetical protein